MSGLEAEAQTRSRAEGPHHADLGEAGDGGAARLRPDEQVNGAFAAQLCRADLLTHGIRPVGLAQLGVGVDDADPTIKAQLPSPYSHLAVRCQLGLVELPAGGDVPVESGGDPAHCAPYGPESVPSGR